MEYKNEILFVPYHSDPVIVKSVETVYGVGATWSGILKRQPVKLKRQIFTVLGIYSENYEISRLRNIN